jgi:hypothetical protein
MHSLWASLGSSDRALLALLALLLAGCAAVLFVRAWAFGVSKFQSRKFAAKWGHFIAEGGLAAAATTPLGTRIGAVGRVVAFGLGAYRASPMVGREITLSAVSRALEQQSQREARACKRGLRLLSATASVSPFIGLLALVLGVRRALADVPAADAWWATASRELGGPLATMAAALCSAILSAFALHFLTALAESQAADVSAASHQFLSVVAEQLGPQPPRAQ